MATTQHTHDANVSMGAERLFGGGAGTLAILSSSRPLIEWFRAGER